MNIALFVLPVGMMSSGRCRDSGNLNTFGGCSNECDFRIDLRCVGFACMLELVGLSLRKSTVCLGTLLLLVTVGKTTTGMGKQDAESSFFVSRSSRCAGLPLPYLWRSG